MKKSIVSKQLGPDLMLYDSGRDEVHILNQTARLIYGLHQEGRSMSEIKEAIKARFHMVEDGSLDEDIRSSLEELRGKGLIEIHE